MRAQMMRDLRAEADAVRARMLTQKQKARQDSPDFRAALSVERQGASLYEQLNFKEAAEKFREAETLFVRATMPVAPPPSKPPGRPPLPPSFSG